MNINVGDAVRSFDFPMYGRNLGRDLEGERAAYVEGYVVDIVETDAGYDAYHIMVNKDVFGGEESDARVGNIITAPVNGTPCIGGKVTDGVELLNDE